MIILSKIILKRTLLKSNVCYLITLFTAFTSTGFFAKSANTNTYTPIKGQLCNGYPQVQVPTKKGTCLGIMVNSAQGLKMPRYAAQLSDGTILVTDLNSWDYGSGSVWALKETVSDQGQKKIVAINLFPKNDVKSPNGIAVDDKDQVYIGLPMGIFRFRPLKEGSLVMDAPLEPIVTDFSNSKFRRDEFKSIEGQKEFLRRNRDNRNKHPLINFVFDKSFRHLYVNIGAPSDSCNKGVVTNNRSGFCEQTEGEDAAASIYHYEFETVGLRQKILKKEVFARGLRNSLALALHDSSGNLLQGENSRDFKELDRPDEELNWVKQGNHYGWPYCYSKGRVSEEYQNLVSSKDCLGRKYTMPLALLPPHAAPLGMLYSDNQLLMSYHGYRDAGHKVVSFNIDTKTGLPLEKKSENLIFGWNAKNGIRPMGSPVGLLKLKDGNLLIVEDKNKSILILGPGKSISPEEDNSSSGTSNPKIWSRSDLLSLKKLREKYFTKSCSTCHSEVFNPTLSNEQVVSEMYKRGFLSSGPFAATTLFTKIDPKNRLMPPPGVQPELTDKGRKDIINVFTKILRSK